MCLLEIEKSLVYFITAPKGETHSHLLAVLLLLLTVNKLKLELKLKLNQEERPRFSSPMTACFFLSISLFALYLWYFDEQGAIDW